MTRINTNVSSLNAQKTLARSQASLQESLTRLSTGLRINAGKDDPAGLIASEVLRSDIISVERAITNTERANQVISTADSALGQVSNLLNDIRGLVTEAANTGAMSEDQIAANQLQIDSSLEAINRIAQTTSFQGRKLLDGSLDFLVSEGTNYTDIADMEIAQANLGATGSMDVDIRVTQAAEMAEVTMTGSTDSAANATVTLGASLTIENGNGGDINLYSADGTAYKITFTTNDDTTSGDDTSVTFDGTDTITVDVDTDAVTTVSDVVASINTAAAAEGRIFAVAGADATDTTHDFADGETLRTSVDMVEETLTITADTGSEGTKFNNMEITFERSATASGAEVVWTDNDVSSSLVISLEEDAEVAIADIITAIESATNASGELTATSGSTTNASTSVNAGAAADAWSVSDITAADTGVTGGGVLADDLVLQLTGETGSEFLNFEAETTMAQIASAVNAISDTLGMTASVADGTGDEAAGTLILSSSSYGSDALIDIEVVSEGGSGTFEDNLSATRDTGSDIVATVNGSATQGSGNTISLNTAMLDLEATITAGVEETISFSITGGGALFQIGPDVESTQQAQLGIGAFNTAQLRGESGRLYQLGSGQDASLTNDAATAADIVDEVITKVTSLRGRLGAFQKTTLDTNIATLNDTLENLTAAESSIRDADFAAESAKLTRNQILVQSGVSVLAMANQNPQAVLSLLR